MSPRADASAARSLEMQPSAEDKARLAEERLRAAIEALPEGIVFLDAEGRYVLWNSRYAEIYQGAADLFEVGARLEDTLRVGIDRGLYPEAVGREQAWLAERLGRLNNPGERHEQWLADGRCILIEERRTQDGGAVGIRVDITDLKRAEREAREARARAEAANKAKSLFVANMSHEVRTPLNGILGLAQVLLGTGLETQQRELVETIVASADHLNRILSDVLDLSRAESGRLSVCAEPFHLGELVRRRQQFYGSQAQVKGLAFATVLAPDADAVFIGDEHRIQQVLDNLLSNALKFTAAGAVRLVVSRVAGDRVRFEVQDTGIGFEPGMAERLFERFEQADSSITRAHGGSGLGLAICRELCGLMGGEIHAVGRPRAGALFTFELPLPPHAEPEPVLAAFAPDATAQRPVRVLLAEDNPTNQKVVKLVLAAAGDFDVQVVDNGRDAVESFRDGGFDLVLMDMHMPVMDGLSATRAIRAFEAQAGMPSTPVLVLSANAMDDHVAASLAAGADRHLPKPFEISVLLAEVRKLTETGMKRAAPRKERPFMSSEPADQ